MSELYIKDRMGDELAASFYRSGQMVGKRALRHMRASAKMIKDESIANAPVDYKGVRKSDPPRHELERAHHIEEKYGDEGRLEATVWVGGDVDGVNVDDYALWIHEGYYQLGKASIAKAAANGHEVGPGYLHRALAEFENEYQGVWDEFLDEVIGDIL